MTTSVAKFIAPREQRIRRVGVVTVTSMRCDCGRCVEPDDFEAVTDTLTRAICSGCHRDLFQIRINGDRT